jgi:hypothetical protein
MRRTHLGVQAAIVLSMVAFVSWPQFRPVRPQSGVWRYVPTAILQAKTEDAARFAGNRVARGQRPVIDQTTFTTAPTQGALGRTEPVFYTPAAVAALGAKLNALVGFARTSLNVPIPYARLVLRNIRTGQVLARMTADEHGRFSFLDLEANAYVVELLGADGSVVAASPMVSMARGDVQQTIVRAAAAATAVSASFGNNLNPTLAEATTVAENNGVTRTTTAQTAQESPR